MRWETPMSADREGPWCGVMKAKLSTTERSSIHLAPQQTGCSNDSPESTALPLTLDTHLLPERYTPSLGDYLPSMCGLGGKGNYLRKQKVVVCQLLLFGSFRETRAKDYWTSADDQHIQIVLILMIRQSKSLNRVGAERIAMSRQGCCNCTIRCLWVKCILVRFCRP